MPYIYVCIPIGSMYGIHAYIWLNCMVNVGKYTIHASPGIDISYTVITLCSLLPSASSFGVGFWVPERILPKQWFTVDNECSYGSIHEKRTDHFPTVTKPNNRSPPTFGGGPRADRYKWLDMGPL